MGLERDERMSSDAICQMASQLLSKASKREATQAVEMIETVTKLLQNDADLGQLKLINSALKEMRYSYEIFNKYKGVRKVSIFGSARTPEDHPDYLSAHTFGKKLAEHGWMSITGAGDGIMKAGHEGPGQEASFGLRIRLPFETTANDVIAEDPKLVNFRYFFTRKLMFLTHSEAVAALPGGFGTMDELFETLTLIQTNKLEKKMPIYLFGREFWDGLINFEHFVDWGVISPDDINLFKIVDSVEEAYKSLLHDLKES